VIPEAFNVNPYSKCGRLDSSIRGSLIRIARERRIAFVAGLIDDTEALGQGHSCACLIDGNFCTILSRKTECDKSSAYRPCERDCDGPTLYRGVYIAALICMDASQSPTPPGNLGGMQDYKKRMEQIVERHRILEQRMNECGSQGSILCIPARMTDLKSKELAAHWSSRIPCTAIVLANATPRQPSIIRSRGSEISSSNNGVSEVRIHTLAK